MAEWSGRASRRNPWFTKERVENQADDEVPLAPESPGGVSSPQHPGEVPDRSDIPGHHAVRVPPPSAPAQRTEDGTAQGIMDIYAASPGEEMDPSRFEQATAAFEELRKAYPAQTPPARPGPGYALNQGDATASEGQELDSGPVAVAPLPPGDTPDQAAQAEDASATAGTSGESRWAESAPKPGDLSSPAGTLPPAKESS